MGHVDHGKTKLLDAIRKTDVVAGEAGGITQHIGAYQVHTEHEGIDRAITFIDTPGHEAFTAMRARGAQVTDIAILVVAADDGVMPQTIEALNHAQAAGVPIVVAVNKMDKEGANPAKIRQQLTEYNLVAEEYGGDTMFVDISALKRLGIDELLEAVLLTADAALDLRANPDKDARGVAIEANLDKGRGAVATVLVQSGTLHVGDAIVAGTAYGRVRAMFDEHGSTVTEAGPARPVLVLGLASVPGAGDTFLVAPDDRTARQIAEKREAAERAALLAKRRKRISLEDFTQALQQGKVDTLNLVLKGDVSGAVEALEDALLKIDVGDEVDLRVIHRGVGAITQNDVNLATVDNAIIIGFNVKYAERVEALAEREGVDVRFYSVIYQAIDEVEAALKGMLKPEYEEAQLGTAEVREVFRSSKFGNIAGSLVRSGSDHAATPRRACCAAARSWATTSRSSRSSGSRTTRPRSARASSAASASGRSTTSRSATSSRRSRCGRSPAADRTSRSDRPVGGAPGCPPPAAAGPGTRALGPAAVAHHPRRPCRPGSSPSVPRLRPADWLRGPAMADPPRPKLADRIQQIVAHMIDTRVKDPRLGFITVTDVKVTGDLQHAVGLLHGPRGRGARADTAAALESAKGLHALGGRQADRDPAHAVPGVHARRRPGAPPPSLEAALQEAARRDAEVAALAARAAYAGDADPYSKPEPTDDPRTEHAACGVVRGGTPTGRRRRGAVRSLPWTTPASRPRRRSDAPPRRTGSSSSTSRPAGPATTSCRACAGWPGPARSDTPGPSTRWRPACSSSASGGPPACSPGWSAPTRSTPRRSGWASPRRPTTPRARSPQRGRTRPGVTRDDIERGVAPLTGDIRQVPSSVSAIKVDGRRAYARVRAGRPSSWPTVPCRRALRRARRAPRPGLDPSVRPPPATGGGAPPRVDVDVTLVRARPAPTSAPWRATSGPASVSAGTSPRCAGRGSAGTGWRCPHPRRPGDPGRRRPARGAVARRRGTDDVPGARPHRGRGALAVFGHWLAPTGRPGRSPGSPDGVLVALLQDPDGRGEHPPSPCWCSRRRTSGSAVPGRGRLAQIGRPGRNDPVLRHAIMRSNPCAPLDRSRPGPAGIRPVRGDPRQLRRRAPRPPGVLDRILRARRGDAARPSP